MYSGMWTTHQPEGHGDSGVFSQKLQNAVIFP